MSHPDRPFPSPHLVPFDGSFRVADAPTRLEDDGKKKENQAALAETVEKIARLQQKFYADDRFSLLIVFQAMDAAGKDGTLRAVLSGVNPAGCQVFAFKAPTPDELDHDFLWRCQTRLPERGRIGVWNRSHYEEVLVVRVNPRFLEGQRLPGGTDDLPRLWAERYESIREFEQHQARNGTVILKFWLHVGKEEQKQRMIERIDEPESNWKFNADDLAERARWDDYMAAYEDALNATSRAYAPWYAIPADSKSYMRRAVAEVIAGTLEQLPLKWPKVSDAERAELAGLRAKLVAE